MTSARKKMVSCLIPTTADSMDNASTQDEQLSVELPPVNTTRSDRDSWSFPHTGMASPARSPTRDGQRSTPRSPMASQRTTGMILARSPRDLHRTYSNAIVEKYFPPDVRDRLNAAGLFAAVERAANEWQRELLRKETSVDSILKENTELRNILQDGQHDQTMSFLQTSRLDAELKTLRAANDQLRADKAKMEKNVLEEGAIYQGRLQLADQKATEALKSLTENQLDLKASIEAHHSLRGQFDSNRSQLIEALQRSNQLSQKVQDQEQAVLRLETELSSLKLTSRDEEQEVVRLQAELSSLHLELRRMEVGEAGLTFSWLKDDLRIVEAERDGAEVALQKIAAWRLERRTRVNVEELRKEISKSENAFKEAKNEVDCIDDYHHVNKSVSRDYANGGFKIEVTK